MRAESREKLAALQAEVVRSVVLREPPPKGVDCTRIAAVADALMKKRARSVAHAWPALARALGECFDQRFAAHAKATLMSSEGTPLADGHAFARTLDRAGMLPEDGKLELLAVEARFVSRDGVLVARRGFAIKAALLRKRIAVVLKLPPVGGRCVQLRLPSLL